MTKPSLLTNYHTHPAYCDGEGTVEEIVRAALAAGLREIGLSSHAPLPFETDWTMPPARLPAYVAEVEAARERFGGRITVLLGVELDWIPDRRVIEAQRALLGPIAFQFTIGSVHFLGDDRPPRTLDGSEEEFRDLLQRAYGGDIRVMVGDYYARVRQMVRRAPISIVGHLDLIKRWNARQKYFRGDEPWYREAVEETLAVIAAAGLPVELNTAGWHKGLGEPYPAPRILAHCRDRGIPIVVNSDAHTPGDVTRGFGQAAACLAELGIEPTSLTLPAGAADA